MYHSQVSSSNCGFRVCIALSLVYRQVSNKPDICPTFLLQFIAANGPVVVGKLLQFTTLLRNSGPGSYNGSTANVFFNGTLTVTCSGEWLT
jgi:hypothetical protein